MSNSKLPRVPFTPQSIEELRSRYPEALRELVRHEDILWGVITLMPGENPQNIFDTESGIRLIVSREEMLNRKIVIHVSPSYKHRPPGTRTIEDIAKAFVDTFRSISGDKRDLILIGVSEAGIPHWIIFEE